MKPDKAFRISCDKPLRAEFADRVAAALADTETTTVLIDFASYRESSATEVDQIIAADPAVDNLRALIRKMEQGAKSVVALVTGQTEGLRLEVMLACHARFANIGALELGFPWLEYGLMPVLGGTQRLPRLCGFELAVAVLLMGRRVTTAEAAAAGLLELEDNDLAEAALKWVNTHPNPRQPWDTRIAADSATFSQSPSNRQLLEQAYLRLRRRISPEEAAPAAILRCLYDGLERSMDAGIRLEAEQWSVVRRSRSTLHRVNTLHRARQKAIQGTCIDRDPIKRVGVLGAGLMGTGIAYTAARAGCEVRVVDVSDEACERSLERLQKIALHDGKFDAQRMAASEELLGRLQWSSKMTSLGECDLIVEAIFEDASLKKRMLAEVSALVGSTAIIASNTTTIPISDLARSCGGSERFVGTHFFAPVDRMELLEIVVGEKTASDTVHAVFRFARQLEKTPIIVHDGPGFFTSRVVAAYLQEALFLLREGVSPWLIDNVAQNAGMILGPLTLADLVSLDLLKAIFESLAHYRRGSAKYAADAAEILNQFVTRSRLGKKTGAGIFDYNDRLERVDAVQVRQVYPLATKQPAAAEIEQRLFAIQSIEAMHAMREGIIEDGSLADLASVLGWSYPPGRGGVISYVGHVGREEFERSCIALQTRFGDRFVIPSQEIRNS
jgi:3-hydroxyacyl-CoA dehydrogenase/enoyl-CoA hydratase/3-hydroxybutyryl-CoA epimerase